MQIVCKYTFSKKQTMNKDYSFSIFLDTRRKKKNGKYPVKLRVFIPYPRKQKLYATVFSYSEDDFDAIWNTNKPKKENKDARRKLQSIIQKAEEIAEHLSPFIFDIFEKKLFRKKGSEINVTYLYDEVIQKLFDRGQISTSSLYELSQKSIRSFTEDVLHKNYDTINLYDITVSWLKDYEYYMVNTLGRSITTVGIYLRNLRAIYNTAIEEKEIEKEFYPFGKRKYQIPKTNKVKKALTKDQLHILFQAKPLNIEQEKAKDFWFFSYACNGMNMKDIALLKNKDIQKDSFVFYRAKTVQTSKTNLKPITVYLNDFALGVIEKYGVKDRSKEDYVFDILPKGHSAEELWQKVQNFTRLINQHLKKLCINNELPQDISTYWARHSFATNSIRQGASMEFISESLGHSDLNTTQKYFAGFESEEKKRFSNELMNFK
jgi:site-specific recombinase XerD